MEEARKKGVALDDEEYLAGVRAVAAAIQTAKPPPAAIWVVGFTSNLHDRKMKEIALKTKRQPRKSAVP